MLSLPASSTWNRSRGWKQSGSSSNLKCKETSSLLPCSRCSQSLSSSRRGSCYRITIGRSTLRLLPSNRQTSSSCSFGIRQRIRCSAKRRSTKATTPCSSSASFRRKHRSRRDSSSITCTKQMERIRSPTLSCQNLPLVA